MTILPPVSKEAQMWQSFVSYVLGDFYRAETGEEVKKEKILGRLEDFFNDDKDRMNVIFSYPLMHSHEITPEINNFDLKYGMARYLAFKEGKNIYDGNVVEDYLNSKQFFKLFGDMKSCLSNLLEAPEKRRPFGHEKDVFEDVFKFLEESPYSVSMEGLRQDDLRI